MTQSWKSVERRLARDVGTERIPATGQRHGADFISGPFAYQVKCRRMLPSWLWTWLAGIRATAQRTDQVGVLVLKTPGQRDTEALVVLTWQDWVDLHGTPRDEAAA
jgi:hypothetical protein